MAKFLSSVLVLLLSLLSWSLYGKLRTLLLLLFFALRLSSHTAAAKELVIMFSFFISMSKSLVQTTFQMSIVLCQGCAFLTVAACLAIDDHRNCIWLLQQSRYVVMSFCILALSKKKLGEKKCFFLQKNLIFKKNVFLFSSDDVIFWSYWCQAKFLRFKRLVSCQKIIFICIFHTN